MHPPTFVCDSPSPLSASFVPLSFLWVNGHLLIRCQTRCVCSCPLLSIAWHVWWNIWTSHFFHSTLHTGGEQNIKNTSQDNAAQYNTIINYVLKNYCGVWSTHLWQQKWGNTVGSSACISGTMAAFCSYINQYVKPTTYVLFIFHPCFVSMENNAFSETWSSLEAFYVYCM